MSCFECNLRPQLWMVSLDMEVIEHIWVASFVTESKEVAQGFQITVHALAAEKDETREKLELFARGSLWVELGMVSRCLDTLASTLLDALNRVKSLSVGMRSLA